MTNNVKAMTLFDNPLDTFEPSARIRERFVMDNQTISSEYNYGGLSDGNGTQVAFTKTQMNEVVAMAR